MPMEQLNVFVVLIVLIGTIAVIIDIRQRRLRQEKLQIYKNSLEVLKNNPSDSNLKQKCLQFGRELAHLSRRYQGINGVTIFDEVALMNDINAACAAAPSLSTKTEISQTLEQRLAKLSELKEKNLLSEQEYNERRRKILDEI
jgi:hypothetical protein